VAIPELLKNLALDTWYKAFLYIGAMLFVISLMVEIKGLTNGQLQLLSASLFFIGIGEWKNHKVECWIKPPNVYTGGPALMSRVVRVPDIIGIAFDFFGATLGTVGISVIIISAVKG